MCGALAERYATQGFHHARLREAACIERPQQCQQKSRLTFMSADGLSHSICSEQRMGSWHMAGYPYLLENLDYVLQTSTQ
jgi:hypothetical protein